MTTLVNRPNTALLVVDMQIGVVAGAYRRDDVVATIAALVDKARDAGVDVVWVQHSGEELPRGSDGWQYVPALVILTVLVTVQRRLSGRSLVDARIDAGADPASAPASADPGARPEQLDLIREEHTR